MRWLAQMLLCLRFLSIRHISGCEALWQQETVERPDGLEQAQNMLRLATKQITYSLFLVRQLEGENFEFGR